MADIEAMEPELSTAEQALAEFDKPDITPDTPETPAETPATDPAAEAEPKPETPAEIPQEQLEADARYQEVAQFKNDVAPVLNEYGIPNAGELKLQLADSQVLYKIMNGQAPPSQLLDVMSKASGWSEQQKTAVYNDLASYLQKVGFLQAGEAQPPDPRDQRLSALEQSIAQQQQQAQQAETQRYQEDIFDRYVTKIGDLCTAQGIDKNDQQFFGDAVRGLLPASNTKEFNAMIERIQKGNFVDVQKAFDTVAKREFERAQRLSNKLAADAQRKVVTMPRVPTGGTPPAPATQRRGSLKNSDDRIAAATEAWDNS